MLRCCQTLRVLVWKHYIVRMRRFLSSIYELISPAILFLLFFWLWLMNAKQAKETTLSMENLGTDSPHRVDKIFFTPDSPKAKALMKLTAKHLGLVRTEHAVNQTMEPYFPKGYWGCYDESELMHRLTSSPPDTLSLEAGVIFQDLSGSQWPRKLNYTIRMKKYSSELGSGAGNNREHIRSAEALQLAIDRAHGELLTGRPSMKTLQQKDKKDDENQKGINPAAAAAMLLLCTILSLLSFYLFTVSRLVLDRRSGVKELMKMVGVSSGALQLAHLVNSLPPCLVFMLVPIIVCKTTSTPVFADVNALALALILFLYFVYIFAFAFLCSTILSSSNHTITLSFVLYILSIVVASKCMSLTRGADGFTPLMLFTNLMPHVPVCRFWWEVGLSKLAGRKQTFRTMWTNHGSNTSAMIALYYQLLQAVLLGGFAWYVDQLRPGKYGTARPWDFPFQGKEEVVLSDDSARSGARSRRGEYFEEPPQDAKVGIRVDGVSKVFGGFMKPTQVALRDVSLDIYKGEITVLLGHNGAGKTTLMSIITGMYSATAGKVYIKGMDTTKDLHEIRKSIGLCPQHNLTFEDITVAEHIRFFAMLKGATSREARAECHTLLNHLNLEDKAGNMSGQLSGGMRRRLQLGCALAGGAEVLILDEPTSGLDVETRREMWNFLLSLRGARTVLLTTHFMEEADALGDRVAALHGGELRCHATPMFLKRAIGTGYRLTLMMDQGYSADAVSAMVRGVVPNANLQETGLNSLNFSLPSKDSNLFPELFNRLEEHRQELRIRSMGVGVTTIEEVFLRLCSDDAVEAVPALEEHYSGDKFERVRGRRLMMQQFRALFTRQYKFVKRKKMTFIMLEILIPFLITSLLAYQLNNAQVDKMFKSNDKEKDSKQLRTRHVSLRRARGAGELAGHDLDSIDIVTTEIPHEGNIALLEYNKFVYTTEQKKTAAEVRYSGEDDPESGGAWWDMFYRLHPGRTNNILTVGRTGGRSRLLNGMPTGFKEPKSANVCKRWASLMAIAFSLFLVPMATISVQERISGTRHIRIMSGVPCAVYLAAMWLFHLAVFAATAALTVLITVGLLDFDSTLNNFRFMGSFYLLLLVYAAAFTIFMYFISYFASEGNVTTILYIMLVFLCLVMPELREAFHTRFVKTLCNILFIFPCFAFVMGLRNLANAAYNNALCGLNHKLICGINDDALRKGCCDASKGYRPDSYFGEVIREVMFCFGHILFYGALVITMQMGLWNYLRDWIYNRNYKPPDPHYRDASVDTEKIYIGRIVATSEAKQKTLEADTALLHNLHKNYRSCFCKSYNSVKGVSFSVKHGECFGLLGVNGAGKTTVFKMLTGAEHPTRGEIFANGYHSRTNRAAYLSTLAYCPQFGGVDDFLTSWENVELMVLLRGVPRSAVREEVTSWIEYVGLKELQTFPVGSYSGGCARRAATAATLAGLAGAGRRLALLDEPTAGVDPVARRRMWAALKRSLAQGLSVIITSHSMDETEALCSCIGIMSRGELGALGSASALRNAHATGYSALMKIRYLDTPAAYSSEESSGSDQADVPNEEVTRLKNQMQAKFNCTLKDEHKTTLHYHIAEGIRYSELFTRMEELKRQFPVLLEDYSISETTLEEVFLAFAKKAHADRATPERV